MFEDAYFISFARNFPVFLKYYFNRIIFLCFTEKTCGYFKVSIEIFFENGKLCEKYAKNSGESFKTMRVCDILRYCVILCESHNDPPPRETETEDKAHKLHFMKNGFFFLGRGFYASRFKGEPEESRKQGGLWGAGFAQNSLFAGGERMCITKKSLGLPG